MSNESKKLKNCTTCGKEIASNAKVCPNCGGKIKKPFYKKWWFIALVVVVVIAVVGSSGGNEGANNAQQEEKQQIEYAIYDVSELKSDLETNALKAENKYNNQYVEITGVLGVIDSDGSYISLAPANDPFAFSTVQCYIKNDEQKAIVAELSKDDIVTVRGKIKSVGELMGYSLDIDSIN